MNAADIAKTLGAAQRSGKWSRCQCPVHGSRTGDSATLALRDGKNGLIVVCHAGCRPADILAELRRRGLLGALTSRDQPDKSIKRTTDRSDDARRIESAR